MMINLITRYWLSLTILTLFSITVLSLWPATDLPNVPGTDKTHHFIAYILLMLPTALKKPKYWRLIAIGFLLFSGAIELIQPYVNRYGEWLDLAANGLGILLGIFIAKLVNYFNH